MLSLILPLSGILIWGYLFPSSLMGTEIWLRPYIPPGLSFVQIIVFSTFMTFIAFRLNEIAHRTFDAYPSKNIWLPSISSAVFTGIVLIAHYGAWVPVAVASVLASPCVLLPPLTYCVSQSLLPSRENEAPPLFTIEETCRIKDSISLSYLIRQFLERYPKSRAYIYKTNYPYSAGGLFLHNCDVMNTPNPTWLEITLDCPFTSKTGVLAEGREVFQAYLARHLREGSIISPLPQDNWTDWLTGLKKKEWFQRIENLDTMQPLHPNMGDLPYQFHEKYSDRQPIDLR